MTTAGQRKFLWVGGATALLYAAFWLFYNTPAWSDPRLNRELFVWPAALGLVWLYWQGFQALKQNPNLPLRPVLIGGGLLALLAFTIPPFHSTDIFGYINRGWQQWAYHTNPYVTYVDMIAGWERDPMFTDHWVTNPSPYGFLYMILAHGLAGLSDWLAPGQRAVAVLVFKLPVLLAFGLCAGLIASVQRDPIERRNALYLFCWNPLLLVHGLANGHNDLLMAALMALGVWAAWRGRYWLILPALTAAVLFKYAALVIVPFALAFLIQQRAWRALALGLALSALLSILAAWPYLTDWRAFNLKAIGHNAQISHCSLHSLLYHFYKSLSKLVPALSPHLYTVRQAIKWLLLGGYGVLMAGLLAWSLGFRRGKTPLSVGQFAQLAALAVFVLLTLVTFKFYSWYLAMVLPLVFLLPAEGRWLTRLCVVLSGTHMLTLTFIGQAHMLNYALMTLAPLAVFAWRRWRRKPGF